MKNYKQILEAVNKGIQLALDDFEDDEVQNIKSKQVYDRDYTKEYLDLLKYEAIDLGLPSGTLWCKYNLDVNPNQLTKSRDWYGGYYAWGELKSKTDYNWHSYKYANGSWDDLTKYCPNNKPMYAHNKKTDGLTTLESTDDIVTVKYGSNFRMPTKKEVDELLLLPNKWVTRYNNISGLNGRLFIGKNGNVLFIPAAGVFNGTIYDGDGKSCFLWTSDISSNRPNGAWTLYLYSREIGVNNTIRCLGQSIRAVANI